MKMFCCYCDRLVLTKSDVTYDEDGNFYHKKCAEEMDKRIEEENEARDLLGF